MSPGLVDTPSRRATTRAACTWTSSASTWRCRLALFAPLAEAAAVLKVALKVFVLIRSSPTVAAEPTPRLAAGDQQDSGEQPSTKSGARLADHERPSVRLVTREPTLPVGRTSLSTPSRNAVHQSSRAVSWTGLPPIRAVIGRGTSTVWTASLTSVLG